MDRTTEKKRAFIINFIYAVLIVGAYYLFVKYALGYLFPFLFAALLSIVLQKPINKIETRLHLKSHGPVSFFLVLLIIVVLFLILTILGIVLFNELKDFFSYLFTQFSSVKEILETVENAVMKLVVKLPASIRTTVGSYVTNFLGSLGNSTAGTSPSFDMSALSAPLSGAWSVVKSVPSFLLSVLVTIISCFFMTIDYENIKKLFLGLFSDEKRRQLVSTKRTAMRGIGKLFKAYATIMLITFSEMFLGLYLMKLIGVYEGGYIAIIALVTCIVDIVPVLGTGTVVVPWALYSLFFDNLGLGIGLLILYAVITVLRQIIEPKLVANQVGLPAIVTIMAMFIGAKLFGTFGIIIMPFTVIILKLLIDEGVIATGNKKTPTDTVVDAVADEDTAGEAAGSTDSENSGDTSGKAKPGSGILKFFKK